MRHVTGEGVVPTAHLSLVTRTLVPPLGGGCTVGPIENDGAICADMGNIGGNGAGKDAMDDGVEKTVHKNVVTLHLACSAEGQGW